jgi:MFS family permease
MGQTEFKKPRGEAANREISRHNMVRGVLHGAFFQMATAFSDPFAVLPLFIAGFIKSQALIGLVISLVEGLSVAPQISIARRIRRRPSSSRPLMLAAIWTRCGVWGVIAAGALLLPAGSVWILILFVILISIYSLGAGIAVLPFKQVITTIPPESRSSFFGLRVLIGGFLAVFAGIIVNYVLGSDSFVWPRNYGVLFFLSFFALIAAYAAMSGFIFPKNSSRRSAPELPPLSLELKHVRKQYPILKRLIAVRLLSGGLPLVLPFLTLYATRVIDIPLSWVGIFIASQKGAMMISNFAWMPIGNRCGTRAVILAGLGFSVLSLSFILLSNSPFAIAAAFAFAGAGTSAMLVGFGGYILELGVPEIQPLLFAIEGTLLMPLYLMPVIGGWIADAYGYHACVITGGVLLLTALGCAFSLCEPRKKDAACGPTAESA